MKHVAIERSTDARSHARFERIIEHELDSEGPNTLQRQDFRLDTSASLLKLQLVDGRADFATLRSLCVYA